MDIDNAQILMPCQKVVKEKSYFVEKTRDIYVMYTYRRNSPNSISSWSSVWLLNHHLGGEIRFVQLPVVNVR